MKLKYICILLLLMFTVSCSEDLGNYDYSDVNEVVIDMNKVYGVRKEMQEVTIEPKITQSMFKDLDHLKFEWYYNTFSDQQKGTLIATKKNVVVTIDPADKKFSYNNYLRFYVTDTITGAKYLVPTMIKVMKPYQGAWMILHREENTTQLGAVEYMGDESILTKDVYFKEQNKHLEGNPVMLGVATFFSQTTPKYDTKSLLFCYTDKAEESGILRQDDAFKLYDSPNRYVYPDHQSSFDCSKVVTSDGFDANRTSICNGNLFWGSMYKSNLYKVLPDATVTGALNITHGMCFGWTSLFFDSEGRRFLHFHGRENSDGSTFPNFDLAGATKKKLTYVVKQENNVPGVNLDDIGTDKEMVFMGAGYYYGPTMMARQSRMAAYAFAKSNNSNNSYVYEFHSYPLYTPGREGDPAPFTGYFVINTPIGVTKNTPMASSAAYNRLLFYAVGNKVYKLDFSAIGGSTTLIYQHPDASAQAKVMKVARACMPFAYDETMFEDYGSEPNRSFGIVFDKDNGKSDFVVLNLTTAGKVDKNGKFPSIQVYSDFGKIKDIVFI